MQSDPAASDVMVRGEYKLTKLPDYAERVWSIYNITCLSVPFWSVLTANALSFSCGFIGVLPTQGPIYAGQYCREAFPMMRRQVKYG